MATRCITASLSSGYTEKIFKNGATIMYNTDAYSDAAVQGTINGAYLNISKFGVYSSSCYMDVYIGNVKVAETVEMNYKDYGSGTKTWVEIELECLEEELLSATGGIKLICYNNNSNTANTYGTSSSGFCEIIVEYTEFNPDPYVEWYNTALNVSTVNGTVSVSWNPATVVNGNSSNIIQYIVACTISGQGFDGSEYTATTTGTSHSFTPPAYNTELFLQITAEASGVPNVKYSDGVTFTVTQVIKTYRSIRCYVNGQWQDCIIRYYDGSGWIDCTPKYYDGTQWIECSF